MPGWVRASAIWASVPRATTTEILSKLVTLLIPLASIASLAEARSVPWTRTVVGPSAVDSVFARDGAMSAVAASAVGAGTALAGTTAVAAATTPAIPSPIELRAMRRIGFPPLIEPRPVPGSTFHSQRGGPGKVTQVTTLPGRRRLLAMVVDVISPGEPEAIARRREARFASLYDGQ